ncbi:MAG: CZB domain-containing protein [gamma proteobacterium symbiont of Bathyaustriella thionipta]|nr:CZB domain-containing protein [gamma proteobacterium symbiont of Bathyaustriella thionipta]
MDRKQTVWKLRDAKRAHIRWVGHAHALIEGLPLEKNQVPVEATDCAFGNWYYAEGQSLSMLPSFKGIEAAHSDLHNIYMQIFKLLFVGQKKSLFGKLFGRSATVSDEHREKARALYKHLQRSSEHVIHGLESLEHELMAMKTDKVEELV